VERRAAYFHAIRAAVAADLRPGGNLSAASNASAEILANGARLAVLAEGDEALEQEIDPWMIETVTFMSRVYGGWTQVLRHGGPSPAWAPLERDVGRWLNERLPLLDAEQRAQVARAVFAVEEYYPDRIAYSRRWPGFDAFWWGLGRAESWMAEGALDWPDGRCQSGRGCGGDFDAICVRDDEIMAHREQASLGPGHLACGWFRQALSDPLLLPRLAAALGQRGASWAETFVQMIERRPGAVHREPLPLVALWTELEPYPDAWAAATRALTEVARCEDLDAVAAAAGGPWAAHPEQRGLLLHMVLQGEALCGGGARDPQALRAHLDRLGIVPGETVLRQMLDQAPWSLPAAVESWPALKPAFSPTRVLLDHVDAYLGQAPLGARQTLVTLAERLCESRDRQGLARLHGDLQKLAAKSPGKEAGGLGEVLAVTTKVGGCMAR